MKKIICAVACAVLLPLFMMAQHKVSGFVKDSEEGMVLPFAHVGIENTMIVVSTDINGYFEIKNLKAGTYTVKCSFMGFATLEKEVIVDGDKVLSLVLEPNALLTEEIIIKSTRSSSQTPIAHSNISAKEVEQVNLGQDLPILLQMTPSVVSTSDAGAGVGYSGFKIRGSDGTRINITINGIPVNDSESHGVWWVNMPDMASSVENIQIQRGVGTSTNGAAAFGGTVNLLTNTLNTKSYGEISSSLGSFNTFKNTMAFSTGLLNSKWVFDGRLSRISSDGYVDRAQTDLSSYYLSAGYYGKKHILKFIHFSGKEKTYQAWYGTPKDSLSTNRTFNPAGIYYKNNGDISYYDNETDNYTQSHYQVHYAYNINSVLNFNTAIHLTTGEGYYEQFKEDEDFTDYGFDQPIIGNDTLSSTDLIRRLWLDNKFYGIIYGFNYNPFKRLSATIGGGFNKYEGGHYGDVIWAEIAQNIPKGTHYYDNNAIKTDLNTYAKINYNLGKLNIFGDIQHRRITYDFLGKAIVNTEIEDIQQNVVFNFINPKGGFMYDFNPQNNIYGFCGVANKEPVRDDFTESTASSRPRHETLYDFELGFKRNTRKYTVGLNAYFMNYKDQLVLTGEINDVGNYTRKNIDASYRAGIEGEMKIIFTHYLDWQFNITGSMNKIKDYTEYYDVYDAAFNWTGTDSVTYNNTDMSFSPALIGSNMITFKPYKNTGINIITKYVGKQYIDNTASDLRTLDAYLVNNLRLSYLLKANKWLDIECTLLINNILDTKYVSNAWVYNAIVDQSAPMAVADGYYPQAGRNFLAGLRLKFK